MQPTMQFIFVMSFVVLVGHALVNDGQKRCTKDMDEGPCRALIERFFYNMTTEKCEKFYYGGCYGNKNNFLDESSCTSTCKGVSKREMCSLKSKRDACRVKSARFYYNKNTKECKKIPDKHVPKKDKIIFREQKKLVESL
uniref:Putative salivary kunitz domain protein n=1 Tax=Ixodes ricinus TaxID=34613 RepID=A0A0K8RJJ9_IXORI